MKLNQVSLIDKRGVVLAKLLMKVKQKKIQGMRENDNQNPAKLLRGRTKNINFKKEFDQYVDENYGDILDKHDKEKLKDIVEDHFDEGGIDSVEDLQSHIEELGIENNIIFASDKKQPVRRG